MTSHCFVAIATVAFATILACPTENVKRLIDNSVALW